MHSNPKKRLSRLDRGRLPLSMRWCSLPAVRQNRPGFTLLEILIALFIFVLVLSTIYASYTGTLRIVNETEYQADVYGMARIALERIYEDLESVYLPPPEAPTEESKSEPQPEPQPELESETVEETMPVFQFVGARTEVDDTRADTLRFASRAHPVFGTEGPPGGIAEIGYYVEEKEGEEGLVLFRSGRSGFGFGHGEEDSTGALILCEGLQSLTFTYYDAAGDEYEDWDSMAEEFGGTIPRKVSIRMAFVNRFDPEAPYNFMITVTLPEVAGGAEKGV
jgi:general secretion pathway protein J